MNMVELCYNAISLVHWANVLKVNHNVTVWMMILQTMSSKLDKWVKLYYITMHLIDSFNIEVFCHMLIEATSVTWNGGQNHFNWLSVLMNIHVLHCCKNHIKVIKNNWFKLKAWHISM